MSINLHVEDYCQNCPKFEPELFSNLLKLGDGDNIYCHDIYCSSHDRCKAIVEHLKDEFGKGDDKNSEVTARWLRKYNPVDDLTTFKCTNCGYDKTYAGHLSVPTDGMFECKQCGASMDQIKGD